MHCSLFIYLFIYFVIVTYIIIYLLHFCISILFFLYIFLYIIRPIYFLDGPWLENCKKVITFPSLNKPVLCCIVLHCIVLCCSILYYILYFPIAHNTLSLPPKFCINNCF